MRKGDIFKVTNFANNNVKSVFDKKKYLVILLLVGSLFLKKKSFQISPNDVIFTIIFFNICKLQIVSI